MDTSTIMLAMFLVTGIMLLAIIIAFVILQKKNGKKDSKSSIKRSLQDSGKKSSRTF